MSHRSPFLIIVMLGCLATASPTVGQQKSAPPAAGTTTSKSDEERLQGTWVCIITLKDGKQVADFIGVRAVMQGNRLTWHFPGPGGSERVGKATFSIDASQNPKHFNWQEANAPRVHRRLYVQEGDVLIWSANLGDGPLPPHFSAGQWQFVMRRSGQ